MYTREIRTVDHKVQAFTSGNRRDFALLTVAGFPSWRPRARQWIQGKYGRSIKKCNHPRKHTGLCLFTVAGSLIGGPRDVKIHKERANTDGSTKNDERTWQEPGGELVRTRVQVADTLGGGHVSTVYALVVRGRVVYSAAGDASVKASFL
jgi:hypothetical protein